MPELGISHLFQVEIDGWDIGLWTECSGLTAKYEVEDYVEGGENMFVHKLPGRLTFENIKLKRPIDSSSPLVAAWFASVHASSLIRTTASITLRDSNLETVATWRLSEVVPVRWAGPSFNATGSALAVEELELAHHGFVPAF